MSSDLRDSKSHKTADKTTALYQHVCRPPIVLVHNCSLLFNSKCHFKTPVRPSVSQLADIRRHRMSVGRRINDDVGVNYDFVLLSDTISRLIEAWPGPSRRRGWPRQVRQARRLSSRPHTTLCCDKF